MFSDIKSDYKVSRNMQKISWVFPRSIIFQRKKDFIIYITLSMKAWFSCYKPVYPHSFQSVTHHL